MSRDASIQEWFRGDSIINSKILLQPFGQRKQTVMWQKASVAILADHYLACSRSNSSHDIEND
jgi:hypothetical protein